MLSIIANVVMVSLWRVCGMTNPVVVRHIDDKGTNATKTTKCIYQT